MEDLITDNEPFSNHDEQFVFVVLQIIASSMNMMELLQLQLMTTMMMMMAMIH
jgi:hypothetical protein